MDYIKYGRAVREVTVGASAAYPFATYPTIQEAVTNAQPGDHISIYPGNYDEAVLIPDTKHDIVLIGASSYGSVAIAPQTAGLVPLELNGAKGVTLINIDLATFNGTSAYALRLREQVRRFRAFRCKFEGSDTTQVQIGNTAADAKAPSDCTFDECEFAWGAGAGLKFGTSSQSFPSEIYFSRCLFHDLAGAWVALSAGGSFLGCAFKDCDFLLGEGVAPTTGINVSTATGALSGGTIQLASNAAGLGTHTNMKFMGVRFTDSLTTV
jgi:hypothetical protein